MDHAALTPPAHDNSDDDAVQDNVQDNGPGAAEGRAAPRTSLLIRAAKLVTSQGEFVCVLRDVSETGICVRLFHSAPAGDPVELHMPAGGVYALRSVWEKDREAGFEFIENVDVSQLINESGEYPKRGLRLGVYFPITISTLTQSSEALVENLSQQGARFESDAKFAIDQSLRLSCDEGGVAVKDLRAKVRWRRDKQYGVVFDDTLTLSDFARFAASIQCPRLID